MKLSSVLLIYKLIVAIGSDKIFLEITICDIENHSNWFGVDHGNFHAVLLGLWMWLGRGRPMYFSRTGGWRGRGENLPPMRIRPKTACGPWFAIISPIVFCKSRAFSSCPWNPQLRHQHHRGLKLEITRHIVDDIEIKVQKAVIFQG